MDIYSSGSVRYTYTPPKRGRRSKQRRNGNTTELLWRYEDEMRSETHWNYEPFSKRGDPVQLMDGVTCVDCYYRGEFGIDFILDFNIFGLNRFKLVVTTLVEFSLGVDFQDASLSYPSEFELPDIQFPGIPIGATGIVLGLNLGIAFPYTVDASMQGYIEGPKLYYYDHNVVGLDYDDVRGAREIHEHSGAFDYTGIGAIDVTSVELTFEVGFKITLIFWISALSVATMEFRAGFIPYLILAFTYPAQPEFCTSPGNNSYVDFDLTDYISYDLRARFEVFIELPPTLTLLRGSYVIGDGLFSDSTWELEVIPETAVPCRYCNGCFAMDFLMLNFERPSLGPIVSDACGLNIIFPASQLTSGFYEFVGIHQNFRGKFSNGNPQSPQYMFWRKDILAWFVSSTLGGTSGSITSYEDVDHPADAKEWRSSANSSDVDYSIQVICANVYPELGCEFSEGFAVEPGDRYIVNCFSSNLHSIYRNINCTGYNEEYKVYHQGGTDCTNYYLDYTPICDVSGGCNNRKCEGNTDPDPDLWPKVNDPNTDCIIIECTNSFSDCDLSADVKWTVLEQRNHTLDEFCDVDILGRIGSNEGINEYYKTRGYKNNRPYYFSSPNNLFIYWTGVSWHIAPDLSGNSIIAYASGGVSVDVAGNWAVHNGQSLVPDHEVIAQCDRMFTETLIDFI